MSSGKSIAMGKRGIKHVQKRKEVWQEPICILYEGKEGGREGGNEGGKGGRRGNLMNPSHFLSILEVLLQHPQRYDNTRDVASSTIQTIALVSTHSEIIF